MNTLYTRVTFKRHLLAILERATQIKRQPSFLLDARPTNGRIISPSIHELSQTLFLLSWNRGTQENFRRHRVYDGRCNSSASSGFTGRIQPIPDLISPVSC